MTNLVSKLFGLPTAQNLDLDAPQAIEAHRALIRSKPFLKKLYMDFYRQFQNQAHEVASLQGDMLELGSGGGFLKSLIPEIITSDVCPDPEIDKVAFADHLPFAAQTLKAIFGLNVLHHLAHPERFFHEAERTLVTGGRVVMIEPFNSAWGRLFYKHFHHEPFDETTTNWDIQEHGRLTTSNQALPWIIFHRDRSRFQERFPNLRIKSLRSHTALRYPLSGGLTYRTFVPSLFFSGFTLLDQWLSAFPSLFPLFETIVLEKR